LQIVSRDRKFRVYVQKIEKANPSEELANPSEGMRNPQNAIRSARHVVRSDQFTHPRCVEIRDSRQIQQDSSLTAAEERVDPMPQLGTDRRAQPALNVKDRRSIARGQQGVHLPLTSW
jgi:hypothetical protein